MVARSNLHSFFLPSQTELADFCNLFWWIYYYLQKRDDKAAQLTKLTKCDKTNVSWSAAYRVNVIS